VQTLRSSVSRSISKVAELPADAEELFDGNGGAARGVDFGLHGAGDGDVQIGGREFHTVVGRLQEHIGQDRQRGTAAHDILHRLQSLEDLLLGDREFHMGLNKEIS
jgi:hypothetical protein